MVQISPGPWTAERTTRSYIEVRSAPDESGMSAIVAYVDSAHAEANAAAIRTVPELIAAIRASDIRGARDILADAGVLS